MNILRFKTWLESREYSDGTVVLTIREIKAASKAYEEGVEIPARLHHSIRRLFAYAHANPDGRKLADALKEALDEQTMPGDLRGVHGGRRAKARKLDAVSIPQEEWDALVLAIEEDPSGEARVLEVMTAHGMRISDVLRMTERAVSRATKEDIVTIELKGGKKILLSTKGTQDVWEKLYDAMKSDPNRPVGGWENVTEWICPKTSGHLVTGSAQKRIARALKTIGKEAGVTGRIHPHRLRRTVAVRAYALTGDLVQVQQLLNHASLATTARYTDEQKTAEVGRLQEKLRKGARSDHQSNEDRDPET